MSKPTHIGDVLRSLGAAPPDNEASNVRPIKNAPTVTLTYVANDDLDVDAWADQYVSLVMQMDRELQQAALAQEAS